MIANNDLAYQEILFQVICKFMNEDLSLFYIFNGTRVIKLFYRSVVSLHRSFGRKKIYLDDQNVLHLQEIDEPPGSSSKYLKIIIA